MTYIQKQVQGGNVYLHSVRSYKDPETKKVSQEITYLGKEVDANDERSVKPLVDRKSVRRLLDSGPYVTCRITEDHGFIHQYEDTLYGLTAIKHAAGK